MANSKMKKPMEEVGEMLKSSIENPNSVENKPMLTELSPEQEKIMYETRDYWINLFFDIKNIDEEEFRKGIDWIYETILKKAKPEIVISESWIAALVKIASLKDHDSLKTIIGEALNGIKERLLNGDLSDALNAIVYSRFNEVLFNNGIEVDDDTKEKIIVALKEKIAASIISMDASGFELKSEE